MKNINISRTKQCRPLMYFLALAFFTIMTTSCNKRSAIMIKKVLHDIEHASEHHEGKNNDEAEEWIVDQDPYQKQSSNNNMQTSKEGKLSVYGIIVSNEGYMFTLDPKYNCAIVTQDALFLENNMIRKKAYMNNESSVTVHIDIYDIPVNGGDYPEYKTVDVSSYKFKSQDDRQTFYFNVYK